MKPQWKELKAHPVSNLVTSRNQNNNVPQVMEEVPGPPDQMELF